MGRPARVALVVVTAAFAAPPSFAQAVPTIEVSHSTTTARVAAGQTRTLDAKCPAGARAVWGYVSPTVPGLLVPRQGPRPEAAALGWRATVRNTTAAAVSVKVGASCQRGRENMSLTASSGPRGRSVAGAAGGSRGLHYTAPQSTRLRSIAGDDAEVVTVVCREPLVIADVWIESADGGDLAFDAWDLREEGGVLDVEIDNRADAVARNIVVRFRCKRASGGLEASARGGSVSPRRIEIVERSATTTGRASAAMTRKGAIGTVTLRCPPRNSVIESAHVFPGSGRVLSEGPLGGIGGWTARLDGVRSGDRVGMAIVCLQAGAAVRIVRAPGVTRAAAATEGLCGPFASLGGCRDARG